MTVLIILAAVIVYLFVGGIVCGLLRAPEEMSIGWPVFLAILALAFVADLGFLVVRKIRERD